MDLNFKTSGRKQSIPFVMLLAGMLISCETLVGIVPESRIGSIDSKLVVHAYLSPSDTLIRVFVTQSNPVFSDDDRIRVVDKANVILSDAAGEVTLEFDPAFQVYTALPAALGGIRAGNTYRLRVTEGARSVEASTTVPPSPLAITSYHVDTSYSSGRGFGRNDTTLAVRFSWLDIPGVGHYYRTSGSALVHLDYREYDSEGRPVDKRGRAVVPLNWDRSFGRREFQSDINEDGGAMESPLGRVSIARPVFFDGEENEYAARPTEVRSITLDLLLTDEAYYRYHRSVEQNEESSDNPFAEPTLLYSNIGGGLGVFASFNSFSIEIKP